ncbi:unnamed protein product, partial [Tetraodon nigroviridis]
MAAPIIETCHVACCANRTPNVVSWGRGGTIAFGTCHSVALYDPLEKRVLTLLNGHTGRVNVVKWIHKPECASERHLVSGGSDSRIIIWEARDDKYIQSVECKGHTGPVCALDAIYLESNILVASAASDSTVRLWLCTEAKEVPILACGGDTSQVLLYVLSSGQLQRAMSLPGHEDWVRGVAWASRSGELLLASCSQDCLIRVWKLRAKCRTDARVEDDRDVIRMKEDVFEVMERGEQPAHEFAVSLETVLAGHENWVYGLHWQPPTYEGGESQQPLSLLSASMDKTMIIWAPEEGSGVWVEQVSVQE